MAVIVVNFHSIGLIRTGLAEFGQNAVTEAGEQPYRVVIVDNLSTMTERSAVRAECESSGWTFVAPDANRGFGAGVNAGLCAARDLGCPSVLLLNPDARVSFEVLIALREHCREHPDDLVCPVIETPDGRIEFAGSQVSLRTGRIRGVGSGLNDGAELRLDRHAGPVVGRLDGPTQGWLSGACLAADRRLLERTGGLSEDYFLYWEDVDLSARVEAAGGRLIVRTDLRATHAEGGTQLVREHEIRSSGYYYWNCRNRLLFAARMLPRRAVLRWIVHTPTESWQILMRGGKRQLLRSPRPLVAAIRGSLSGVGVAARELARLGGPRHRGGA